MDNSFIENLLNTDQEKQLWQSINIRLEEQLQKLYEENIDKLAESASLSGTKILDDPIHPKHVTTAPREIIIHIEAEISTTNEKNQLEDISRLFDHYYHIAVPANTDYNSHLSEFVQTFDNSVKNFAPRINPAKPE